MWIRTVVGSGIALTLYDRRRQLGGMTHYCRAKREEGSRSTAMYAAPAIFALVKMLVDSGSRIEDLEAQLYGGASNPKGRHFERGLHERNIQIGFELLNKYRIKVVGVDVGGYRGRKVGFHSATGEVAIAKVNNIRNHDWYPQLTA